MQCIMFSLLRDPEGEPVDVSQQIQLGSHG